MDSASSCHVVGDLSLLDGIIEKVSGISVKTVGGETIELTRKGSRTLSTPHGVLSLKEAYYSGSIEYNLISIPKLIEKGLSVNFMQNKAYMRKGNTSIQLIRKDGLWAIPTLGRPRAAALRMQRNGAASAKTWHNRIAHVGHQQIKEIIKQEIVPKAAAGGLKRV